MGSASDIQTALEQWAGNNFVNPVKITNLKRLSGGASQETWAFETIGDGHVSELILRRAPGGVARARTSEAIPLSLEADLLRYAGRQQVPVPAVIGVADAGSALGEAFIMERIKGETIARKILRDETYEPVRGQLAAQCGAALAGIHSIPVEGLSHVPASSGLDQVHKYEDIYRSFDLPRPVFELALAWLKQNAPAPLPPVLVHGDFRLGNLIIDISGLAAVLDWELAHIGDPREDIAWICVNAWRFGQSQNRVGGFGQLPDLLQAYKDAGGTAFSEEEIDWWEMLGSLKWGIMCMIMYEAFRSGADPSVERATIGRRVSENEIDLINLLEAQR